MTEIVKVITSPEQVKNLPWKGNWAADEFLHVAVSRYTRNEPDPHKAYAAERWASILGMGADLPEQPDESSLEYMREVYSDAQEHPENYEEFLS